MASLESYSSQVVGWLVIGNQRLPLAQAGPSSCVLRQETSLAPGAATIIIEVDGQATERRVVLHRPVVSASLVRFGTV